MESFLGKILGSDRAQFALQTLYVDETAREQKQCHESTSVHEGVIKFAVVWRALKGKLKLSFLWHVTKTHT